MIKIIFFHFVVLVFLTGCFNADPIAAQSERDGESLLAQELETGNSIPIEQRLQNQMEQERNRSRKSNPMNNYNILKRGE